MTPEQVQWGLEHLDLTQEKLDKLGFGGIMRPVKTSCADHMGTDWARIIQWDGGKFKVVSDWYQSDKKFVRSEERRVGKSVSVRVDLGGRRIIKKKKT